MLCMRALRVTVCDMLGCHAGGLTHEQILKEILYLTTDEIRPYLAYAAPARMLPGACAAPRLRSPQLMPLRGGTACVAEVHNEGARARRKPT